MLGDLALLGQWTPQRAPPQQPPPEERPRQRGYESGPGRVKGVQRDNTGGKQDQNKITTWGEGSQRKNVATQPAYGEGG